MTALRDFAIPELGTARRGKVRDIYERGDELVLIASDRISCFDRVLEQPIPNKGQVLTEISAYWFEVTQDIVPNHLHSHPHGNVMIVQKCQPLAVEMIVRGYIAGSMWRDYEAGKRQKCGVALPEGLTENQQLPTPIVTPTTKAEEGHDEDITKEELIAQGIVSEELWDQLETISLNLYERGNEILSKRGLNLVDTKYEFGIALDGTLTLIDEIHTPDSSRFWYQSDKDNQEIKYPDKEFVRGWLMEQGFKGSGPVPNLPEEVIKEAASRYASVYETLLDRPFVPAGSLMHELCLKSIVSGRFVQILCGSEKDFGFVDKIADKLGELDITYNIVAASAHKVPRQVLDILDEQNNSLEPMVYITVAGRSNALSGVVAANTKWPVIACPPHKDLADYQVNIHSTLQMPSGTPVLTVVDPANAALAAKRILDLAKGTRA